MKTLLIVVAMFLVAPAAAQDVTVNLGTGQVQEMKVPEEGRFQKALRKAIQESRKKGEMSARQAIKLRVALLSPSFRKRAEDLAVTQMAFSENAEVLPRGTDGKVDRANIDWEKFLGFLEALLPILLQLLDLFSAADVNIGAVA